MRATKEFGPTAHGCMDWSKEFGLDSGPEKVVK